MQMNGLVFPLYARARGEGWAGSCGRGPRCLACFLDTSRLDLDLVLLTGDDTSSTRSTQCQHTRTYICLQPGAPGLTV